MISVYLFVFFFFKQKTAYELRISDWSSDVCSSDLLPRNRGEFVQTVQDDGAAAKAGIEPGDVVTAINGKPVTSEQTLSFLVANIAPGSRIPEIGRASCRERVCQDV